MSNLVTLFFCFSYGPRWISFFYFEAYADCRMGLAISLVSAHPEKVWYHKCPSRGVNCLNTALVTQRGCAIWYDEPKVCFL